MAGFNWIDIGILIIVGMSAFISLFRGFVREVLSLASWIAAFAAALLFSHKISDIFLTRLIHSPTLRLIAAFAGIFLVTLITCAIATYFMSKLVDKTGLSGTDRLLGLVFGLARGIFLIAALLLAGSATPLSQEEVWQQSQFIPYFKPLELWIKQLLPVSIEEKFQLNNKL